MPEPSMREKLECSCHATLSKVSSSLPTAQLSNPQRFICSSSLAGDAMPDFSARLVSKIGDTHTAQSRCLAEIESHDGSRQPNSRDCGVTLLCADGGTSKSGGLVYTGPNACVAYCGVQAKTIYFTPLSEMWLPRGSILFSETAPRRLNSPSLPVVVLGVSVMSEPNDKCQASASSRLLFLESWEESQAGFCVHRLRSHLRRNPATARVSSRVSRGQPGPARRCGAASACRRGLGAWHHAALFPRG